MQQSVNGNFYAMQPSSTADLPEFSEQDSELVIALPSPGPSALFTQDSYLNGDLKPSLAD
jgi:hypothetical protein